ncbi:MFS general substrate transporter [Thozetella sp. PMI_491]|nr:MFS general substrate transporter [Thozetella sp. PMI_491]
MEPENRDPQAERAGWMKRRWEQWRRDQIHDRDALGNPLEHVSERELREDMNEFRQQLSDVTAAEMETALEVARQQTRYYMIARRVQKDPNFRPPIQLAREDWTALIRERDTLFSQRGTLPIILTVSLAAFLQGHFQSSLNASSIFAEQLGVPPTSAYANNTASDPRLQVPYDNKAHDWQLGGMNAIPYFISALVGAPLSLPINYWVGRRGALGVAALLMIASSIGSAFANNWKELLGVRVISGIAMGMKAVSAPILASETASGFWRGSIILAWQIWVAFGIMAGAAANLVIAGASDVFAIKNPDQPVLDYLNQGTPTTYLRLILGAPLAPALCLLISVAFCYESPRFYMRQGTPNYDPDRAYKITIQVRGNKLLALRDLILMRWSNLHNGSRAHQDIDPAAERPGLTYATQIAQGFYLSFSQYRTLFTWPRTRGAIWSSGVVNLAQQLCGNTLFSGINTGSSVPWGDTVKSAMLYSFGFGAINFGCGLFAMRSIDVIGRRRWLLFTLPLMSLFLLIAALVLVPNEPTPGHQPAHIEPFIAFIMRCAVFAAAYSPGLGPIPFTLASESFPLSHREAGASVAIAVNLFFAGLLTILYPLMDSKLHASGAVGLFSGLNMVAFVLIYFLVEETRRLRLEDLDLIFDQPKRRFIIYQAQTYLPYFVRRYLLWKDVRPPRSYDEEVAARLREKGTTSAVVADVSTVERHSPAAREIERV